MTLQSRLWITQDHWKWHHSKAWNRDFFIPPLHSTPSLRGSPSEYRHKVWYVITRMVRLPEGDKSLRIRLLVLTESTNVADGRTDRRTDTARWHCLRLCIASRGKNYREPPLLINSWCCLPLLFFVTGSHCLELDMSALTTVFSTNRNYSTSIQQYNL